MNHRPRTLEKNVGKVTPKRIKWQLALYDCVRLLLSEREGVIVDDHHDGWFEVELFDPSDVGTIYYNKLVPVVIDMPERYEIIDEV